MVGGSSPLICLANVAQLDRARNFKTVLFLKGEIMKELLIIFVLLSALVCVSACMLPKTKEEQILDDEAQIKYLKEYQIKHRYI